MAKSKDEKLDELDDMLLDALIDIMNKGKTNSMAYMNLSDLATVSNYLAKNNKVSEKKKSTVEEEVRARTEAAKKRRAAGVKK